MQKKFKVTTKFILSAFLACGALISLTKVTTASANNFKDTIFHFNFSNRMEYTVPREKADNSKLYMKCNNMSVDGATYTAHVIGTNNPSAMGADCSRGYTYKLAKGSTYYLTNWVKENGYTFARIGASPNYSYNITASGIWSPDNYSEK